VTAAPGFFFSRTGRGSRPSDRATRPLSSLRGRDRPAGRPVPVLRVPDRRFGARSPAGWPGRAAATGPGGIGVPEAAICRTT